ncbi:MAG: VWA domain-containing protein, partial [Rubrivivax sp.]
MTEALAAIWPLHWLRPWALLGLPLALALLLWGRRARRGAVPRGVIDEALLPHLLVHGGRDGWLRPADTLAAAVAFFSLALAGPAWQREPPPLALEAAPLVIALDLSDAMDAADLPPSRLDRARAKLQLLLAQRGDAPTGLVVYAGSAHLVLPPTQDRAVLGGYLDALATTLMPT